MFVRTKTTPNSPRKSVQIVESYKLGNKIKQRIVRHVGIAIDEQEEKKLKELAEFMIAKMETKEEPLIFSPEELARIRVESKKIKEDERKYLVDMKELIEKKRVVNGIHDVYGKLYDEMGYDKLLKNPARQKAASELIKNIVLARVADPKSKRASVGMLEEEFGISLNLDSVYGAMDKLDEETIDKMKYMTSENTKSLFKEELEVVFFDCTTLYFETFEEDELRKLGYSKDMKFNQPQIMLSMLVTKQGMPIDYAVHEGNTYEGHTLISELDRLRDKHKIGRVVIVADSAMLNSKNIAELENRKIEYIVGAKIKNFNKEITEKILTRNDYKKLNSKIEVKEIEITENQRLIISYKEERARKDKHDRKKAIDKLIKRIKKNKDIKGLISNYGYKKYIKVSQKANVELDEERLKKESQWDGLHGIVTNAKLQEEEIINQYNNLWQIEDAFRVTKHDLRVRPVFHWKPRRIKAHVAICYMAYSMVKHLGYRIKLMAKESMSPREVRYTLMRAQTSIVVDKKTDIHYAIPSNLKPEGVKIYKTMGLKYDKTPYILKEGSA